MIGQEELFGIVVCSFKGLLDQCTILITILVSRAVVIVEAGILVWSGMEEKMAKTPFLSGSPVSVRS